MTVLFLLVALLGIGFESHAQTVPEKIPEKKAEPIEVISYGANGLDIRSPDGNFNAHIDWRAQIRFTHSTLGGDPINPSPEVREGDLVINRARFKLGGHAYQPWLTYYFEYDFPSTRMLDLRLSVKAHDAFRFRVGQWKVPFNRERVDSSGKQQFVERSIVNDYFTLDRQQGALLFGRLWPGSLCDSLWNVGVFSATGRGGTGSVDRPMWLGRWQWNFFGSDLGFSQSDIDRRQQPVASIALAGATWRGPYTAFSSAGGGQLPDFESGDRARYDVHQVVLETALQWRGLSWQQEYHVKSVDDTVARSVTNLRGGYAQLGWFPSAAWQWFPRPLEAAFRYAAVDPNTSRSGDLSQEWTLGFNWFFSGHRNKITLDVSHIQDPTGEPGRKSETRTRLQWDISF